MAVIDTCILKELSRRQVWRDNSYRLERCKFITANRLGVFKFLPVCWRWLIRHI